MDFFNYLKTPKLITLIISILLNIIFLISTLLLIYMYINKKCECPSNDLISCNNNIEENNSKEEENIILPQNYHVEIKGAVKNPGVYEVNDNNIIIDVIKMAGGFNKNAYSDNINLSYHLQDELVIFVYTKDEYKKDTSSKLEEQTCKCETYDITNCKDNFSSVITSEDENKKEEVVDNKLDSENKDENNSEKTDSETKLVNINTASKNELMTLTGIGESKAEDIINYREKNGLFKSIDEIKKVNGIKDATFNKIKDYITV